MRAVVNIQPFILPSVFSNNLIMSYFQTTKASTNYTMPVTFSSIDTYIVIRCKSYYSNDSSDRVQSRNYYTQKLTNNSIKFGDSGDNRTNMFFAIGY